MRTPGIVYTRDVLLTDIWGYDFPGETRTVQFTLTAADLAFVNTENKWITEPGEFEIKIGNQKTIITYQ